MFFNDIFFFTGLLNFIEIVALSGPTGGKFYQLQPKKENCFHPT